MESRTVNLESGDTVFKAKLDGFNRSTRNQISISSTTCFMFTMVAQQTGQLKTKQDRSQNIVQKRSSLINICSIMKQLANHIIYPGGCSSKILVTSTWTTNFLITSIYLSQQAKRNIKFVCGRLNHKKSAGSLTEDSKANNFVLKVVGFWVGGGL